MGRHPAEVERITPEEAIAMKLLGWTPIKDMTPYDKGLRGYSHAEHGNAFLTGTGCPMWRCGGYHSEFPDFTDDRLKWYWIRRMEDALAERGLLWQYFNALNRLCGESPRCLRATAEQRVEAALKALEEKSSHA
jgi:hypothetical protein